MFLILARVATPFPHWFPTGAENPLQSVIYEGLLRNDEAFAVVRTLIVIFNKTVYIPT
jgi:hypothetical protein